MQVIYLFPHIKLKISFLKETKHKEMRENVLSRLYEKIKLNSISLADFFRKKDIYEKSHFSMEEFNEILKEQEINIVSNDLKIFMDQIDQKNNKITINQLLFYCDQFLREDLKEVKNII